MRRQNGFSLIELLIVVAIILIIAAIAIPNMLKARMSSNNSAAASTIRSINTAQVTYASSYPLSGYAGTWTQLGPVAPGTPCTAVQSCLLDEIVACGTAQGPCPKSGYNYFINDGAGGPGAGPNPALGTPPDANYTVSATPIIVGNTGDGNYCSFGSAVVESSKNAIPSLAAPPAALTVPGETAAGCAKIALYGPIQ